MEYEVVDWFYSNLREHCNEEFRNYAGTTERRLTDQRLQHFP